MQKLHLVCLAGRLLCFVSYVWSRRLVSIRVCVCVPMFCHNFFGLPLYSLQAVLSGAWPELDAELEELLASEGSEVS